MPPSLWLLPAALLLAVRFFHLGGPIDDPHSWRQCDTAHYSLDFARRGFDLLHPAVNWLGGHRTLIFEFPLPEALSAMAYRAFGASPMWDRLVSLAFFVVSALYLYRFTMQIAPPRAARLTTLAYLALPLGMFYSRAAHVDFAAIAAAHGLLHHGTLANRRRSVPHAAAAAVWGVCGALVKAPYLMPVLLPLGLAVLASLSLPGLALSAFFGACTAIAFVAWRRHVDAVNGAAPNWTFLPGFYKESNPLWWYIGEWSQRLERKNWITVARRLALEVATPLGALLAAWGLAWRRPGPHGAEPPPPVTGPSPRLFAALWLLGALAYLAVFFPLNVIHNYYQMPFLAPVALLIGLGADAAWRALPRPGGFAVGAAVFGVFLVLALVAPRRLGYYRVDWLREAAGSAIRARTPANALLVVADHNSGYSDPRLLFRADREGWPLAMPDLEPARLDTLAALGARELAVVTDVEHPELSSPAWLAPVRVADVPLARAGRPLGRLELFRLDRAWLRTAAGSR